MKLSWSQIGAIRTATDSIELRIEALEQKTAKHKEQIKAESAKTLENGQFYERHINSMQRNRELIHELEEAKDVLLEMIPSKKR